MKTKFMALLIVSLMVFGMSVGCGVQYEPKEDTTISYLYVDTYSGGFGSEFLNVAGKAFESANSEKSYAAGKKGVKVIVGENANNNGSAFKTAVNSATSDIHVVEGMYYNDYLQNNSLLDITDVVTEKLSDGKTIESKLNTQQKQVLKYNEKYYTIPTFAGFSGLTYNKELFANNNLFFADSSESPDEISSYTGSKYTGRPLIKIKAAKKSPGPDGKYNTEDDGLPSSYEEFFYLFDKMLECSPAITPFISYAGHYTNYLFQELLCAASTTNGLNAMFSFDSNGEEIEVIDGWNSNGTPKISKVEITEENGYQSTMEASRYMALKFIRHLSTNKNNGKYYVDSRSRGGSLTNTNAQKFFLESSLDPSQTPIATICEGVYWYNESSSEREGIVNTYGNEAKNMNLAYMTLPAKELGTVTENNGTTQVVCDALNYYLVINSKVANDGEKQALAKDFLKFMYTDDMLRKMTIASNIPFALKYDLEENQYNSLDKLPQSFWNIYKAAKDSDAYVTGMSISPIFIKNTAKFSFKSTNNFFKSKVNGAETADPFSYFFSTMISDTVSHTACSAKDFFVGMSIDETVWNSAYKN